MKQAIILFSRIPVEGKTKTRLMPFLTGEECARLHGCFIKDIFESCRNVVADVLVCYEPEGELQVLKSLLDENLKYYEQRGENLGIRMKQAFEQAFDMGYEKAVLIGTDIPQLTEDILEEGLRGLDEYDIVIHPTKDGGYYLVGMKKAYDKIWNIERYGTNTVIEDTLLQIRSMGLRVRLGTICRDVDTKEDLLGLYQELQGTSEAEYTRNYIEKFLKDRLEKFYYTGVEEK